MLNYSKNAIKINIYDMCWSDSYGEYITENKHEQRLNKR